MAKRKSQIDRGIDILIESSYYAHCAGTQINIMDIPKLFTEAREGMARGGDIDTIMPELIVKYHVK